jgi:hypothetical protein
MSQSKGQNSMKKAISITMAILSLVVVGKAAKADEWNPGLMVMPSPEYIEAGAPCPDVDVEKKRIYLEEWGKAPYVLIGEEVDISPRWNGIGRAILATLQNGNEVYIDKSCVIANPLSHYRTNP